MHLIALHDSAGSSNPLGISANYDRIPFAPYYLFKDLVTIFLFIFVLSVFVFFMPNVLGDSENYVMANPMQTPPAIVPEWYLLPFYAILRSIPNKLLGVIAMFSAILILLVMPFTDLSRSRGIQFRPLSKIAFYVSNFLILMQLGAKHVEYPFIEFGQISTIIYFAHFLIIVPFVSLLENSLIELASFNTTSVHKDTSYEGSSLNLSSSSDVKNDSTSDVKNDSRSDSSKRKPYNYYTIDGSIITGDEFLKLFSEGIKHSDNIKATRESKTKIEEALLHGNINQQIEVAKEYTKGVENISPITSENAKSTLGQLALDLQEKIADIEFLLNKIEDQIGPVYQASTIRNWKKLGGGN
jgi:uncharacterized membrane protein